MCGLSTVALLLSIALALAAGIRCFDDGGGEGNYVETESMAIIMNETIASYSQLGQHSSSGTY